MKSSVNQPRNDGHLSMEIIRDWKSSPAIRAEFRSISTYAAFIQAQAAGHLKIAGVNRGRHAA